MAAKARTKKRSAATPKGARIPTKPSSPPPKKPATEQAPKAETSRKRARNVEPDPEIPSEPKPKLLMRLPVELIIEIAKHTHPFNLTLLSRTNKYFRHYLMSRAAIKIWQSSLRTVEGLPPCPDDICEPKYAALLFVGECSTCGVVTSRTMDPLFLVRLCVKCSRKQLVCRDSFWPSNIDLTSTGNIIPVKRGEHQQYRLIRDADAVEAEYERRSNGDRREFKIWRAERVNYVAKREREAQSLRKWAEGKELDGFKSARKADIEARLVKLGWERTDFQSQKPWRRRQWTFLVYNAKPMDDQVWEELFPRLLEHLEANRGKRLKKEADERESARIHMLNEYMASLRGQLKPLVQAKLKVLTTTTETDQGSYWCQYLRRLRCLSLFPIFPLTGDCNFCPESTAMIETDISMDTFELEFPTKAAQLSQLIDEARSAFEGRLVRMLPNDTQPVDSQGTEFDLVAGTGEDAQLLDVLPLRIRKLLRADAVFRNGSDWCFYPFERSWHVDSSQVAYDPEAATLARSFLHALGRPNASYAEMKALGSSFVCGRCNCREDYYNWEQMILHYQEQARVWQGQSKLATQNSKDGKTFTLVFTHDASRIGLKKPLVRLVHGWNLPDPRISNPFQKCKLCDSVGIKFSQVGGYLPDHVRDVHLINAPVNGVHYESVN